MYDASLLELYLREATKHSRRVAISCGRERVTFGQLETSARGMANYFAANGVGSGDRVAIALDRSPQLIAAILALLRLGAVPVPIDSHFPAERLQLILGKSEAAFLIISERFGSEVANRVLFGSDRLLKIEVAAAAAAFKAHVPHFSHNATSPLYILYTSGSTGVPKGIEMCHGAFRNLVQWQLASTSLKTLGVHTMQYAPITFDVSFQEIFVSLCSGGTLFIVPEDIRRNPDVLLTFISEKRIERLFLPSVILNEVALAAERQQRGYMLKEVITAGEQLVVTDSIRKWFSKLHGCILVNQYGPTETHVVTEYKLSGNSDSWPTLPPIGHPIQGVTLHILDAFGKPVASGVEGELYIGGVCLSNGYVNEPELTNRFFVSTPLFDGQVYKTGDLVRQGENGELHFCGRADSQVKIRGFRVELSEVEIALSRHELVLESVVDAPIDQSGHRRLVAFVVPNHADLDKFWTKDGPGTVNAKLFHALYPFLKERLPDYMIPVAFVAVDRLPLTQNGKIDRRLVDIQFFERPEISTAFEKPLEGVEEEIAAIWEDLLQVRPIGRSDNFFHLGGHSLLLVRAWELMPQTIRQNTSLVSFFEDPTIRSIVTASQRSIAVSETERPTETSLQSAQGRLEQGDIAIIGMACRMPGANTLEEYWANLCRKVESITVFNELGTSDRSQGVVNARGVLDGIELFDAEFWGYSNRDATLMDPQHRLFFECVWEAMERASYNLCDGKFRVGMFASSGLSSYFLNQIIARNGGGVCRVPLASMHDLMVSTLNDNDYVSTKVSFKMNFNGPSINVQTACSSSLVAVHLASKSLLAGECDFAFAGATVVLVPQVSGYFSQGDTVFSPDGHCRPFDADARGTVLGNGVGVVLLKLHERALRDGDNVLAVIKGSAINNDGARKADYSATSVESQVEVIRAALRNARLSPEAISFIEAHGTGTLLGDPIEVEALKRVFARNRVGSCVLGSVKGNIGHTGWASGVAGLIKAVLCLQHKKIPPTLHFRQESPDASLAGTAFYINKEAVDWHFDGGPRRAGVSAFGLGGTNAHVVLEESKPSDLPVPSLDRDWHLVALSAKSREALLALAEEYRRAIAQNSDVPLEDIAFSANCGRRHFRYRTAFVAKTTTDLLKRLQLVSENPSIESCPPYLPATWSVRPYEDMQEPLKIAFLFSGQGFLNFNIGRSLYTTNRIYAEMFDKCDEIVSQIVGASVKEILFAEGASSDLLAETAVAQPVHVSLAVALVSLLDSVGINATAVLGHSLGEYVAAYVAGVLDLKDVLTLVANRGALMQKLLKESRVVSVRGDRELLSRIIERGRLAVHISAYNSPTATLVTGPIPEITRLASTLKSSGFLVEELDVRRSSHTLASQPIIDEFREILNAVRLSSPQIQMVSNLTGALVGREVTEPEYWCRHSTEAVNFQKSIRTLAGIGINAFIEVGPTPSLLSLGIENLPNHKALWLPTLRVGRDDWQQILDSLATLYVYGAEIDWGGLDAGLARHRVVLPTYPFQRKRHWLDVPMANMRSVKPDESVRSKARIGPGSDMEAADSSSSIPLPKMQLDTSFFELRWSQDSQVLILPNLEKMSTCIVIADHTRFVERIRAPLSKHGKRVISIIPSERFQKTSNSHFQLNLRRSNHIRRFLSGLPAGQVELIFVKGKDVDSLSCSLEDAKKRPFALLDSAVNANGSLLRILQESMRMGLDIKRVTVVTHGSQCVEEIIDRQSIVFSSIWALANAIALEYPDIKILKIDLDPSKDLDEQASSVVNELLKNVAETFVAYREGRRYVGRLKVSDVGLWKDRVPIRFPDTGFYLVVGGLGGIGRQLTNWLVSRGVRKLLILGRGKSDDNGRDFLAHLRNQGAAVDFVRADASELLALLTVFKSIRKSKMQLKGIFHLAGVLEDGIILSQTDRKFEKVLRPKVQGSWNLHLLSSLLNPELQYFVLFSSATALVGTPGQSNHAAGNAFLDALADYRRAQNLPALSISWGPWAQVGELSTNALARKQVDHLGFQPIKNRDGLLALEIMLGLDQARVGFFPISWNKFLAKTFQYDVPYFHDHRLARLPMPLSPDGLPDTWQRLPPNEKNTFLERCIRSQLLNILDINQTDRAPSSISKKLSLFSRGLDSLGAAELRNALNQLLQIRLPPTFVYENPNIESMLKTLSSTSTVVQHGQAMKLETREIGIYKKGEYSQLSTQQERWVELIRKDYGYRLVPIVLYKALDLSRLRRSLEVVLSRHELLRYVYAKSGIEVLDPKECLPHFDKSFVDVSHLAPKNLAAAIGSVARAMSGTVPDISKRPSWELRCLKLSERQFVLLLSLQHIDFDGTSLSTFIDELCRVYAGLLDSRSKNLQLDDVPQYKDYVAWQRNYRVQEIHEDRAFFRGLFLNLRSPTALVGHSGFKQTQVCESTRYTFTIESRLWNKIRRATIVNRVSPFSIIFSAYARLIGQITGMRYAVISVINSGRSISRFGRTIGPFTAPFPIPVFLSRDHGFELVQVCNRIMSEIASRAHYPVTDLIDNVPAFKGFPRDTYFSDVGINFTNYHRRAGSQPFKCEVLEILGPLDRPVFREINTTRLKRVPGLHLVVNAQRTSLQLNYWYHVHRFSEEQIKHWNEMLLSELSAMLL